MRCEACREFVDLEGAKYCPACGATIPEAPADPLLGSFVGGRYLVRSLVAEGGMGRVYAAEQAMGGAVRKVAIKVLLTEYSVRDLDMQRFARECSTVAELDHPNTIKFYDYGTTPSGEPYIAMEFLAGHALSHVLKAGPLPAERVDLVVGQICGSLQEAHDRGIVHRDLKPDNVILTSPGGQPDFVKVLDFGIAKRVGGTDPKLTPLGVVLGSPPYMSPEQFTLQDIDARSDVYSLAVMTFQALTGQLPFVAQDPMEWAHLHINTRPLSFDVTEAGRFVPESMRVAILKALSKNPNDRHASMREFYADFTLGTGALPGRLPSFVPIAPDHVAMVGPVAVRAPSRPPPREESLVPRSSGLPPVSELLPSSSEPTRESDMRRAKFETSAPRISVSELRPSALSSVDEWGRGEQSELPSRGAGPSVRPDEEFAARTEETPEPHFDVPRVGRAGTMVMVASEPPPPPVAPVRARVTMPDLLPPTVRDPQELTRVSRSARGTYLWVGVALALVGALAGLAIWFFFFRSGSSGAPSRAPRVNRTQITTSRVTAGGAPPITSSERSPDADPSARGGEPSPCQTAVYAAVSGKCDLAKRSFARCPSDSAYHASAQRTMSGLCP
jgi:serine/threonine protein kinase